MEYVLLVLAATVAVAMVAGAIRLIGKVVGSIIGLTYKGKPVAIKAKRRSERLTYVVVSMAGVLWGLAGFPGSIFEWNFVRNATNAIEGGDAQALSLAATAPGKWETVCGAGGYGGPIYVEKYKKTYQPVGDSQDGAWGLIFINSDGTYQSAAGSCRTGIYFAVYGCMPRSEALLSREPKRQACPVYGNR